MTSHAFNVLLPKPKLYTFFIFLGKRKRDDKCEPLCLTNEDGWKFLCITANVLKQWKSSGLAGLTKETFTACLQSIEAMSTQNIC